MSSTQATSSSSTASDELGRNILAAGVAGAMQISIFQPLDCLRIRWQVAGSDVPTSTAAFMRSIARSEGLLRGLYLPGLHVTLRRRRTQGCVQRTVALRS